MYLITDLSMCAVCWLSNDSVVRANTPQLFVLALQRMIAKRCRRCRLKIRTSSETGNLRDTAAVVNALN